MLTKIRIIVFLFIISMGIAVADEPYNYARRWRSWDVEAQEAYITGVEDGATKGLIVTMTAFVPSKQLKNSDLAKVNKAGKELAMHYTRDQLRDVITDLYKDPANAYIYTIDMIFLARDKIEGKDISKGIMVARKRAMDDHKLNEEMKGKK